LAAIEKRALSLGGGNGSSCPLRDPARINAEPGSRVDNCPSLSLSEPALLSHYPSRNSRKLRARAEPEHHQGAWPDRAAIAPRTRRRGDWMRRRDLIAGLLLTTAAQPAVAQQSTTTHRVAIFHPAIPAARIPEDNFWQPFLADLRGLNDIGGENLLVERYSAEGHHERYADLAKEIVHSNPDVIVTVSIAAVIALTAETKTIPVVASMLEDPLKAGLVTSLARPGSNLTGVSLDAGVEIWGKRLQLLKEAIPSASTVAFLGARQSWEGAAGHVLRGAGARLGISLIPMLLQEGTPSEIERVFALMGRNGPTQC